MVPHFPAHPRQLGRLVVAPGSCGCFQLSTFAQAALPPAVFSTAYAFIAMPPDSCIFATRKSPLALAQTALARRALETVRPEVRVVQRPMSTTGDERLQWSLEVKGGKGLFTSELERAILAGEADCAVHSAKDLPTEMDPALEIFGYLPREDPSDVLILREGVDVPSTLASGSPRRRGQVARIYPGVTWKGIRGNVGTRLQKLADGHADGGVMAAAGLRRLEIDAFPGLVFRSLSPDDCVPAAGQGAIAIQGRRGEGKLWEGVLCAETAEAVTIERAALAIMGGGCNNASAAHWRAGRLYLYDDSFGARQMPFTSTDPAGIESRLEKIFHSIRNE